jgi:hypothetical protein
MREEMDPLRRIHNFLRRSEEWDGPRRVEERER